MSEPAWLNQILATPAETPDETGEHILQAAHELFLTFGLRKTSIEDIARKAGIGRPTLYRRFADKDAIIRAVLSRESQRIVAEVVARVGSLRDPADMLVQAFVTATRLVSENPLSRRLLDTEPELILPFLTLNGGALIDAGHLLAAPARGVMEKAWPGADHTMLLEIFGRLFMSTIITRTREVGADDEVAVARMVRAVLGNLSGNGETSRKKS